MKTTLTWKERIMAATSGRNNREAWLWYSHDRICSLISEAEGVEVKTFYRSLSAYLAELIKSGHLERAVKPSGLKSGVRGLSSIPEYLYRQTGKPFERVKFDRLRSGKNAHTDATLKAIQAHEIWRLNQRLPKWFRNMMMD
jgi:hypothetical protein